MTATYPRRTSTSYRGVIYGFNLLDHEAFMAGVHDVVADDYVGKTRQRGRKRENQHRDDKPWSDLIVGSSHVLWEGICDEDELDDKERELIRDKRPRMNDKDNRWNRERIPYEEQVRQRHQRDVLAGREPWVPLEQRTRASLLEWDATAPDAPPGRSVWRWLGRAARRPLVQKLALWLIGWVLTSAMLQDFLDQHFDLDWRWRFGLSAGLAALLLVWGVLRRPDSWPLWRRRLKRVRRWLR